MRDDDRNDPTQQDDLDEKPEIDVPAEFVDACEEFMYLCEGGLDDESERVYALRVNLAYLTYLALLLPESPPKPGDDEVVEDTPFTKLSTVELRSRLEESFPGLGTYWEILNPLEGESGTPDVGNSDILDDLSDLYLELEEGLTYWKRGQGDKAIEYWREGFENYWGEHATALQKVLYMRGDQPPTQGY